MPLPNHITQLRAPRAPRRCSPPLFLICSGRQLSPSGPHPAGFRGDFFACSDKRHCPTLCPPVSLSAAAQRAFAATSSPSTCKASRGPTSPPPPRALARRRGPSTASRRPAAGSTSTAASATRVGTRGASTHSGPAARAHAHAPCGHTNTGPASQILRRLGVSAFLKLVLAGCVRAGARACVHCDMRASTHARAAAAPRVCVRACVRACVASACDMLPGDRLS